MADVIEDLGGDLRSVHACVLAPAGVQHSLY